MVAPVLLLALITGLRALAALLGAGHSAKAGPLAVGHASAEVEAPALLGKDGFLGLPAGAAGGVVDDQVHLALGEVHGRDLDRHEVAEVEGAAGADVGQGAG